MAEEAEVEAETAESRHTIGMAIAMKKTSDFIGVDSWWQ
jgi:hypothetical protein